MRSRNIKPGYFENEQLGSDETDPLIHLLFAGLWLVADSDGRMEDRPLKIKSDVFPHRTIQPPVFNGYLTELERMGFIIRYQIDGRGFIQVRDFAIHQNPHHTEKSKGFPEPPTELIENAKVRALGNIFPLNHGFKTENILFDSLIPRFTDSLIPRFTDSLDSINGGSVEPPQELKLNKKVTKPHDERVDHPAMKMVHEIMCRWPHKDLWDRIIREIGDNPKFEFFIASYQTWRGVDGNPMNLEKWLFEPAKTGMLPEIYGKRTNGNGNSSTSTSGKHAAERGIDAIIADSQRFKPPELNVG